MSNNLRTRNGMPFNFVNGLKVRGMDIESLIPGIEGIPEAGSKYQFAGNGTNKSFTLPVSPYNKDAMDVYVKQLYVHPDDYTLVGGTVTLVEAPPAVVAGETYNVVIKVSLTTLNGYVNANRVSYEGENLDAVLAKSKPLANYSNLRAYTGAATQVRITDPGIAGFFYYDATDATSADNGGKIIVSSNGKRWKRLFDGAVNVKWFGAKGDGVTDDTAAIQAAIDSCVLGEKALYFPSGEYRVNNTIYLPDSVSNPYKVISIRGELTTNGTDGTRVGVIIRSYAASLFKTKTTPTVGGSLTKIQIKASDIAFFASYTSNPTAICFDTMSISASHIEKCQFYGFNRVIVGSLNGVTHFQRNSVAARVFLYPASAYTSPSADSEISHNYINGLGGTPAGMTTDPLIELSGSGQMTVSNNYIDFAYIGISVGGAGQNVLISENTIDLCFIGVLMKYGSQPAVISNNSFFNINKTKVSLFNSPVSGMSSDNWTCIKASDEYVANRQVVDNRYGTADTFLRLGNKGNWNITERGNVGRYPNSLSGLPVIAVDFGSRTHDSTTYPLDSQYLFLESIDGKIQTDVLPKRNAYFGLQYLIGSPPTRVRVNDDWSLSDMNGSYLWGKTNQLAATDFSSGWTFGTNISSVGGVFTASNGGGCSYINAALPMGTYIVCLNLASISGAGAYITAGYSLPSTPTTYVSGGSSNIAAASGGITASVGRAFFKITPSGTTARISIFVNTGTSCTIDYVHVVKIA